MLIMQLYMISPDIWLHHYCIVESFLLAKLGIATQVKTMRVLEYFPTIEDPNIRKSLFEVSTL